MSKSLGKMFFVYLINLNGRGVLLTIYFKMIILTRNKVNKEDVPKQQHQ